MEKQVIYCSCCIKQLAIVGQENICDTCEQNKNYTPLQVIKSRNLKFIKGKQPMIPLGFIPKIALDLEINKLNAILTTSDFQKVACKVQLRKYDPIIYDIENRLIKLQDIGAYTMKSLDQFSPKPLKQEEFTYLNLTNSKNKYEVATKYIVEQNIQFSSQGLDNATHIQWDVETASPNGCVPFPEKYGNVLGVLCAVFSSKTEHCCKVYYLKNYSVNEQQINDKINEYVGQRLTIVLVPCRSEQEIAINFIQDINNIDGIKLLYGFNASMGKEKDLKLINGQQIVGYDMQWLLHRANINFKSELQYGVKYISGGKYLQVKSLDILTNTYILDCQTLYYGALTPKQKNKLQGYKLNDFLDIFGIKTKIGINISELMATLMDHNGDISNIIAYCLYDCYCLKLVQDKHKIIEKRSLLVDIFNVPLSFAFYKSEVFCIQVKVSREYLQQGYGFLYTKLQNVEKPDIFIGATTEAIEEQKQSKVQNNVGQGDYASLYPNAGIAFNISPETISQTPMEGALKVNLNFLDKCVDRDDFVAKLSKKVLANHKKISKANKEQYVAKEFIFEDEYVYFRTDIEGIIPKLQASLFAWRKQINDELLPSLDSKSQEYAYQSRLQLQIKILINCLYGFQGDCRSPFYNQQCARAVTAVGRMACQIAGEAIEETDIGTKIFRDTDSCAFALNGEFNQQIWSQVQQVITTKMLQYTPNANRFDFKFESEEFAVRIVYPKQKKAYARLKCDINNVKTVDIATLQPEIKGISWSLYTQYCIAENTRIFKAILTGSDIDSVLKTFYDYHETNLSNMILNQNVEGILAYSKRQKHSDRDKVSKYLETRYQIRQASNIVPFSQGNKLKSENVIPVDYLTKDNIKCIDITRTLEHFLQPVRKFFGLEVKQYDPFEAEQQVLDIKSDEIKIIVSSATWHHAEQIVKIDQVPLMIEMYGTTRQIEEKIVNRYTKIYFDCESTSVFQIGSVIGIVNNLIQKWANDISIYPKYHVAEGNKVGKWSYHLVYDVVADRKITEHIAKIVNREMQRNVCDIGVYANSHNLRLPMCFKLEKNGVLEPRKLKIITKSTISDFIVQDINNVTTQLPKCSIFDPEIPIQVRSIISEEMTDIHKHLILSELRNKNIKVVLEDLVITKKKYINVNIVDYLCPICDRTHNSMGMYATTNKNTIKLDCFSNAQNKAKTQRYPAISIKIPSEDTKQTDIVQEYLNTELQYTRQPVVKGSIQQNMKETEFKIKRDITFVKANLGTGKSKCLLRQLSAINPKTILMLSFRKVFATSFAQQFNLENYQNIRGQLNLREFPRLMLQVDSLNRYVDEIAPEILVIDEIESILQQLYSLNRKTQSVLLDTFIKLIKNAGKIVALDGILQPYTISRICNERGSNDVDIYDNFYSNKVDHNMIIQTYSNMSQNNKTKITQLFKQKAVGEKLKVYGMITSESHAQEIKQMLEREGIKVKLYSGDNARVTDGKSHLKEKEEDFEDVNKVWIDFDVVLHTSTLTAGISFEQVHFDIQINVFCHMTCTSIDFFQGIHRVRNISSKTIYCFLEHKFETGLCTSYDIISMQNGFNDKISNSSKVSDFSPVQQFEIWLEARQNTLNKYKIPILFKFMNEAGYQIQYFGHLKQQSVEPQEARIKDIFIEMANVQIVDNEEHKKLLMNLKSDHFVRQLTDETALPKYKKMKLAQYANVSYEQINQLDAKSLSQLKAYATKIKDFKNAAYICCNVDENNNYKPASLEDIKTTYDKLNDTYNFDSVLSNINTITCHNSTSKKIETIAKTYYAQLFLQQLQQNINSEDPLKLLVQQYKDDQILKQLDINVESKMFGTKLNSILGYIGYELKREQQSRSRINGKLTRIYGYELKSTINSPIDKLIQETKDRQTK